MSEIINSKGVYALAVVPFDEDGNIDWANFISYIKWLAKQKPNFIFVPCGTSEIFDLTDSERLRLAKVAAENSQGIPVVSCANAAEIYEEQINEVKKMSLTGVSMISLITNGLGHFQNGLFEYLTTLAKHTSLPIMLYECPRKKPHLMESRTYYNLVETGKFVSIKDTTCTLSGIKSKIDVQGSSSVLQANLENLLLSYRLGARGVAAITTAFAPHLFVKQFEAVQSEDWKAAELYQEKIILLNNALSEGAGLHPASGKYLLWKLGILASYKTRNGSQLTEAQKAGLDVFFYYATNHGILKA